MSTITRFKNGSPCPVCGGWSTQRRGHGQRCWGFVGSDGQYAHCTRPEHAGTLSMSKDGTFAHRVGGDCRCGHVHGARHDVHRAERRDYDAVAVARRIWHETVKPEGTPVERYLRSRGLDGPIPPTLRCHRWLRHPSGSYWPALVAAVTVWPSTTPTAIHRTFLTDDGAKASVEPNKLALAPIKRGSVHLAPHGQVLVVTEGIEDGLTIQHVTAMPVWATLGASNMANLIVPATVTDIVIGGDLDIDGIEWAKRTERRWRKQRRGVRLVFPPPGFKDFNAALVADVAARVADRQGAV